MMVAIVGRTVGADQTVQVQLVSQCGNGDSG